MNSGPRHHGFTLVEILVTTAIMALLTMIALAAVGGSLDRAQSTRCLQSMRQVGAAMQMHAGDNNGLLPSSSHLRAADGSSLSWTSTLSVYLGTNFLGRCPAVRDHRSRITYGWNDLLTETNGAGIPLARCRTPRSTMVLGELATSQSSEHFHFRGASRGVVTPSLFPLDGPCRVPRTRGKLPLRRRPRRKPRVERSPDPPDVPGNPFLQP